MLRFLTLTIIFLALLNAANGQQGQSSDEYAVYNSVMRGIVTEDRDDESHRSYPVILRQTKVDDDVYLGHAKRYRHLVQNFRLINSQSISFDDRLNFGKHFLIDEAELNEGRKRAQTEFRERQREAATRNIMLEEAPTGSWRYFYEKYPDAIALYTLSRAAFTKNREYALVVVSQDAAFTGYTRAYILRRFKSGWKSIKWEGGNWIS